MASNGNINRGIQLTFDVIEYKMFKRKISGRYVICTLYETTQLAECDCKFFRGDQCVSTLKPIPTGIY